MSVRENVAYAAVNDARVDDLAATLEVEDLLNRDVSTLSGVSASGSRSLGRSRPTPMPSCWTSRWRT